MFLEINEFRKEFMGKYYYPFTLEDIDRIESQPNVDLIMDYNESDELVALAVISVIESLTRKTLTIEDFIVSKKYRGQGYGKGLLDEILHYAKCSGIKCIEVATKVKNLPAKKLYEKAGFKDREQVSYRLWL